VKQPPARRLVGREAIPKIEAEIASIVNLGFSLRTWINFTIFAEQ
jgi:hypothetical protein